MEPQQTPTQLRQCLADIIRLLWEYRQDFPKTPTWGRDPDFLEIQETYGALEDIENILRGVS